MKDSILVKLCRQLTKTDLRSLRKFVRSPYFNQREDVTRLMDFLADNVNGNDEQLARERAFRHIFPGQEFDMPQLRYAMSFLLKTIADFLTVEEMYGDGAVGKIYLISALKRRGGDELIGKELPDAFAANEKQPLRNANFFLTDFQLRTEDYFQHIVERRNAEFDLDGLIRSFSSYQVIYLLKVGSMAVSHKNFTRREHLVPFLDDALRMIESGDFDQQPFVLIWFHVYKCLESRENEANFEHLKKLIAGSERSLSPTEIFEIYISAINFCIRRHNAGDSKYMKEAFDLYRAGIENRALIPNGVLSKHTYFNVMTSGARLKETAWVEHFLEEYKQFVPEKDREDAYRFNKAYFLYFHKNDYDNALTLLQQVVQFGDMLYNLDARRMMVGIFFETKAYSALESQLDSYKAYIRRHKEIGYHREHHLNFIRTVGKMISTDLSNAENRRKIRESVLAEKEIAGRDWLLKQLA